MAVISRSPSFYRLFPPLFFAGFAVICVVSALMGLQNTDSTRPQYPPWFLWVLGLICALISVAIFLAARKINLADEVQDAGDALIARKSGEEARIPLADIVNVDARQYPMMQGAYYTVLTLRTPCRFGSEIGFLPIRERKFFSFGLDSQPLPVIKDLIQRIDQARRKF